jgi:haloalkane dehalogenase
MQTEFPHRDYPYLFNPKTASIDGHNLSYLDEGEGPVIVMLHGNPTWSFFYRNLVLKLRDRYRVVVPDHMGCGLSDKPQGYDYTLENHINNIEELLTRLDIERYSLVVHDWGGAIGMGLATRAPERLVSAVVMNTAAFRSGRIPLRINICRTPLLGDIIIRGFNGFAWPATFMAVRKKMPREVVRGYLAPYNSWRNRIATLRFVQDIPLSQEDRSYKTIVKIEKGLEKLIDKPMLLAWGGRDFCFSREFYDEWVDRFPGAEKHYFPEAGHYLLEDADDEIMPLIDSFFERAVTG